jgi:DNA-binding PadR family transcriptional regulator
MTGRELIRHLRRSGGEVKKGTLLGILKQLGLRLEGLR